MDCGSGGAPRHDLTPRGYQPASSSSCTRQPHPSANDGAPASDPRLVKRRRVSQAASSYAAGVGSEAFAVVDDASAGKDGVVATKQPEAKDGTVAKPGEEEEELIRSNERKRAASLN